MSARIELPDFMTARLVEKTYGRAMQLRDASQKGWFRLDAIKARRAKEIGVRMALDRHPKLLLFLEKAAEHLRTVNDEQASRITQEGFAKTDFSEYAVFREAYLKAVEPGRDEHTLHKVYCWVYAAAAEALGM